MRRVIVTEILNDEALAELRADFDVHYDPGLWERPPEMAGQFAGADGLVIRNKTRLTRELIEAAPKVRVVGRLGVGLDNINLEACAQRGIEVCPAVGANADSVAEYVISSALQLRRPAWRAGDRLIAGEWPRNELGQGNELRGAMLGLIGFGSIGQVVARLAANVGMEVTACDANLPCRSIEDAGAFPRSFKEIIRTADVISLHVPLLAETRNLIAVPELSAMKRSAVLINTARGGIVDEIAVADALKAGEIAGAALDVFAEEPPAAASRQAFLGAPNLILTPHIAGVSVEANLRVGDKTVAAVRRVLLAS